MQRELKIDILGADFMGMIRDKSEPPKGVICRGPMGQIFNGPTPSEVAMFLLVTVPSGVAINLVSSWLYDRITKHSAKRIRINGHEPKDKADFERIVRDEVEIGQND